MGKTDDDGWKSALKTIGHVSQIGFTFAFCVLISLGLGAWLDGLVGTEILFKLLFLVLGVLAGAWSVYRALSNYI